MSSKMKKLMEGRPKKPQTHYFRVRIEKMAEYGKEKDFEGNKNEKFA